MKEGAGSRSLKLCSQVVLSFRLYSSTYLPCSFQIEYSTQLTAQVRGIVRLKEL